MNHKTNRIERSNAETNNMETTSGKDGIVYLTGSEEIYKNMHKQRPQPVFSEQTALFLDLLSEKIRKRKESRNYADLITFSFWCRKANLLKMGEVYRSESRIGRGVSVHFTPGNIPLLFAYSMAVALLAGNCVVVRLSRNKTKQEEVLIEILNEILEKKYTFFKNRIVLCRYGHDRAATDWLLRICNVRVIWGSNRSVNEIRRSPLQAGAIDLPFAARRSAAVFRSSELRKIDMEPFVRRFYNDTFLTDQNACSSPHVIFWLGTEEETEEVRAKFWGSLERLLKRTAYSVPAAVVCRKWTAAYLLASQSDGAKIICSDKLQSDGAKIRCSDNRIVRVQVPRFQEKMWEAMVPCGFFVECAGKKLTEASAVFSKDCQTVSYFGINPEEISERIIRLGCAGADRIVPVGHTLDFSLVWDGNDMIRSMSRVICVK